MTAVFSALSKGENVATGLKHVTSDMKSKNRTDKTAVVPAGATPAGAAKISFLVLAGSIISFDLSYPKEKAPAKVKPSKFALEGNKWVVENFVDRKDLVIDETETKHAVYIYGLVNSVVQIKVSRPLP